MTKAENERERGDGSCAEDSVDLNLLNLLTGGIAGVRATTTAHQHINTTTNSNIVKCCCDSPLFYSYAVSRLTAPPPISVSKTI